MNKIICFIVILLSLICFNFNMNNEFFKNDNYGLTDQEKIVKESDNILNDYFDNIFFINLKHREDRKKQILNELKNMDIVEDKIIRIDAIREKYNGHIGCAKSHVKTLKYAKEHNLEHIVIFEDDFIFNLSKDKINDMLKTFLTEYENNWDAVHMAVSYKDTEDTKLENVKRLKLGVTASAYMVNKPFYEELIKDIDDAIIKMEEELEKIHESNLKNMEKKKK